MIAIAGPPKRRPAKKEFLLWGNGCEGKGGSRKSDRMSYRTSRDLILKFESSRRYVLRCHTCTVLPYRSLRQQLHVILCGDPVDRTMDLPSFDMETYCSERV
jgi:hypothetical protein